jgi:TonB-dependent receptor
MPKTKDFKNRVKVIVIFSISFAFGSIQAEEAIEEVVVIGKSIRASQMAAMEAKRAADNVADVISADAIGRFPDQNLADALGRLPGISIERDQGQARYLNFRGAPKRYTTTAFDGIDVPGVENGRIPRFDAYPAVITSQVVANKAITADMPGESVSGFINVKTFQPSDIDGWSLSLELGVGEQKLGGGDVERQNARISYSNEQMGFVLYGSENMREQVTDNREMQYSGTQGALTFGPGDKVEFRNYLVDRTDEAYGGTVEFYLSEGGRVYLSSLNTAFKDEEERNQWNFYPADLGGDVTPQIGTVATAKARRLLESGEYNNETNVHTLGIETSFGEYDVEASFSKIDTLFDAYLPIPYLDKGEVTNLSYDLTNPYQPVVTFDEDLRELDNFTRRWHIDAVGGLVTDANQFKVDFTRSNPWGTMKFGFKTDTREANGGGAPLATAIAMFSMPVDVLAFNGAPWATNMNNTVGGFYADNPGILSGLEAAGYSRVDFPETTKVNIEETMLSAYWMQTVDKDWGNIVFGLRVEDTDYETSGSKLSGADPVPLMVNRTYTNFLPNVHVNWDLAEDKKIRFSFSTGISRPTYDEARAAANISVTGQAISGGNPFLEEETSWGVDAAYEWYFNEASLFALTIFHRSIDNVISESNEKVLGSIYSDAAAEGELWDLSGFGNGRDGELRGIEVSFTGRLDNYTEGFLSGFGIEANATSASSEYTLPSGTSLQLPGQSDLIYNVSIFYEDHGLSARVSYGYRDAWLDETELAGVFGLAEGVYWDAQTRVDVSVRYDLEGIIGHKVSVFLNLNNLTDETDVRYTGKSWNPNQVESYGKRYLAGFRYSL